MIHIDHRSVHGRERASQSLVYERDILMVVDALKTQSLMDYGTGRITKVNSKRAKMTKHEQGFELNYLSAAVVQHGFRGEHQRQCTWVNGRPDPWLATINQGI